MSLVSIQRVTKTYASKRGLVTAVDDVSLSLNRGTAYGILGESGSGKSTLARILLALVEPTDGVVEFDGHDVFRLTKKQLRLLRARFRIVFQEPFESLNPKMRVRHIVAEPLHILKTASSAEIDRRVTEALDSVQLDQGLLDRFPAQLSGGQQQRVGIARAMITNPDLLVLDEPTASLDQAVRGIVLDLLGRIQRERDLTILMISHDIHSLARLCSELFVMRSGRIVESGAVDQVLARPQEPYTQMLLGSVLMPAVLLNPPVGGDTASNE
jgi:ABC-type glutathione transport system ATPase component